jgi:FkbH-like protein
VSFVELDWLPTVPHWRDQLDVLRKQEPPRWSDLVHLANARLDFLKTNSLDKIMNRAFAGGAPADAIGKPIRLAVLSSSTADHLLPGLRVAALRRGLYLRTFLGDFGQYRQELHDSGSALHGFKPNVVLFAFDAHHVLGEAMIGMAAEDAAALLDRAAAGIVEVWRRARDAFGAQVIQQAVAPVFPALAGSNEHRLPGSPAALTRRLNARLREFADAEGVDILALDDRAVYDGIGAWHDPLLWHRAKQEISPAAAPAYGELVTRLIAAQQGRSSKCLVLDLDNTLWGGVIGDDGLEGIRLGQGSAEGEAFVDFQRYARDLSRRGVILAVCSKNDEANALAPFDEHPEMVLRRGDIACFVANWTDKAANLREIAERLNIGVDSLVFADDNPFDPALYARAIADGGYFEALRITAEDLERSGQYQANIARERLRDSATDLAGYLRGLNMRLHWAPFDQVGLQRIVQLINKTNQFNLTTRRYTEQDVTTLMADPRAISLQLRLLDEFGDNGIIGIVAGLPEADALRLDIWLMSCRVLGRGVEEATMNLVADAARRVGASRLIGEYLPTKKNGMVREHYRRLGFTLAEQAGDGATRWHLALADYTPFETFITPVRV